jgi:Probable N6-adenine methyltransferase
VQKAKAEEDAADDPFQENWALSQFWYTEETAGAVAAEAVKLAAGGSIACLACPSLFRRLRTHYPKQPAHLLEYDSRFEVFLEMCSRGGAQYLHVKALRMFTLHNRHLGPCVMRTSKRGMHRCLETSHCTITTSRSLSQRCCTRHLRSSWQTHPIWYVLPRRPEPAVCCAAFTGCPSPDAGLKHAQPVGTAHATCLQAEECLEKTAQTMRLLSRRPVDDPRFLLLTGSVLQEAAQRLLGLRPASFRPQHSHKLGEPLRAHQQLRC